MNSEKTPELTVQTLMALRKETDAVRIITERLKVKEMGPADHIRTKHEIKAFIQSGGDLHAAKTIVQRARERRSLNEARTAMMKLNERHERGIKP